MEKRSKKRVKPREQEPHLRRRNFDEVSLGYSLDEAVAESSRCLSCKDRPCTSGCPVEVDIPAFINLIREGKFSAASRKIKEKNSLPAVCGRVCPQEIQCESRCTLGKKGEPVSIGNLERFASDGGTAPSDSNNRPSFLPPPTGRRVAVIGSGPGGLTCASDLARLGHRVTLFEALHKAGGVLVYGIPEFRLPKAIVEVEVENIRSLGVEITLNSPVGNLFTIDELLGDMGYDACFIATGAGLPLFPGIPGENLNGVYSANEYLTRANLMKAYLFPEYDTPIKKGKKVAVIGGGNVAMDSARVALRLGAEKVYLIYRRTEEDMPARKAEVHHAREEGVEFMTLTCPTRFLGDDSGNLVGIECVRMEQGRPDESGRRRPVPVTGSEFRMDIDVAIPALGTKANPLLLKNTVGLRLNKKGYIEVDEATCMTSKEGVFAGGDIVTGSATVILAMGAGKKAAKAIDEYLRR